MGGEPHTMGLLLYLTLMKALAIGFTVLLPPRRYQIVDLAEDIEQAETLTEKPVEDLIQVEQYTVTPGRLMRATEIRNVVETSISVEIELTPDTGEEETKGISETIIPIDPPRQKPFIPVEQHSKTADVVNSANITPVDEVGRHLMTAISSSLTRTSELIGDLDDKVASKLERVNCKIAKALRLEESLDSHAAKLTGMVDSVVCPTVERVKNIVSNVSSPTKKFTPKTAFCCSLQGLSKKFEIDHKSKGESWNRKPVHSYQSASYRHWQRKRTSFKKLNKIHQTKRIKLVQYNNGVNSHSTSSNGTIIPGGSAFTPSSEVDVSSHHSSSCEFTRSEDNFSEGKVCDDYLRIPIQCSSSTTNAYVDVDASNEHFSTKVQKGEMSPAEIEPNYFPTGSKAVLERIPLHLVKSCSVEHLCEIIAKIFEAWSDTQLQLSVDFNKRIATFDSITGCGIDDSQLEGIRVFKSPNSSDDTLQSLQFGMDDLSVKENLNQYETEAFMRGILEAFLLKIETTAYEESARHENSLNFEVVESEQKVAKEEDEPSISAKTSTASDLLQEFCSTVAVKGSHSLSQIFDINNKYIDTDYRALTIEPQLVQAVKTWGSSCWRENDSSSEDAFYDCETTKSVHHNVSHFTGSNKAIDYSNASKQVELRNQRLQGKESSTNWLIDTRDERTPVITDSSMISVSNIISVHSLWPYNSYSLSDLGTTIGGCRSHTNSSTISFVHSDEGSSSEWISVSSSSSKASNGSKKKKWAAKFIQKLKRKYKMVKASGNTINRSRTHSEGNEKTSDHFKHNPSKNDED